MMCDNQSAIKLALNEGSVQRTRHMGVRAAFLREKVQEKELDIQYVCTNDQAADFLTKPLTGNKFARNRTLLMAILAILSVMTSPAMNMTFEYTSPIIWLPTNNFVHAGVTEYQIGLMAINPCDSLGLCYDRMPNGTCDIAWLYSL
jgi:hypothetical protein